MVAASMAQQLRGERIGVVAVCPGFCRTNFRGDGGATGDHSADYGGERVVRAAIEGELEEVTGTFRGEDNKVAPW